MELHTYAVIHHGRTDTLLNRRRIAEASGQGDCNDVYEAHVDVREQDIDME